MQKIAVLLGLVLLLVGCAGSQTAPDGGSWEDYNRAKYQLVVTYQATEVADCELLGAVSGTGYRDMQNAKDAAEQQAVILGADHLYYQNLSNERLPYRWRRGERELFYADGTAYRCSKTVGPAP